MSEGDASNSSPRRLRDALTRPDRFAMVVELVPWRGSLAEQAGGHARTLAARLRADPRVDAVSVTDGAGGHAMLSPEAFAEELLAHGHQVIVHVTGRDRNRNELLGMAWRLAGAGVENILALTGDYPQEGAHGLARPVFDLDSVGLLELYSALNSGAIAEAVVRRRVPRDRTRRFPPLLQVGWGGGPPKATDFHLGVAVNPFKRVERDVIPQYLKLDLKAGSGARFAMTQVGFDARKLDELVRYVAERHLPLDLVAGVLILSPGTARLCHAGGIPGVTVTDELLARVERAARGPDKGKAFFLELAAKQVAVARGLGYAGAYLSGSIRGEDYARVLDLAETFGDDDWRGFVPDITWAPPDTFYLYEADPGTGLGTDRRAPLGKAARVPLAYRLSRLVHRLAFVRGTRGFRAARRVLGAAERAGLGHPLHVAEQAAKIPMYGCRDCGDCSLPEIAYLCPESQCVKNQRNGPCGGSRDGECEIAGRACVWARAYQRLRPYGEERVMLQRRPVIQDNALRRTSGWANYFLDRDHTAHPIPERRPGPPTPAGAGGSVPKPAEPHHTEHLSKPEERAL